MPILSLFINLLIVFCQIYTFILLSLSKTMGTAYYLEVTSMLCAVWKSNYISIASQGALPDLLISDTLGSLSKATVQYTKYIFYRLSGTKQGLRGLHLRRELATLISVHSFSWVVVTDDDRFFCFLFPPGHSPLSYPQLSCHTSLRFLA